MPVEESDSEQGRWIMIRARTPPGWARLALISEPVMLPSASRWWDSSLIVELGASMRAWTQGSWKSGCFLLAAPAETWWLRPPSGEGISDYF